MFSFSTFLPFSCCLFLIPRAAQKQISHFKKSSLSSVSHVLGFPLCFIVLEFDFLHDRNVRYCCILLKEWEVLEPLTPDVLRGSTCHRFCSCTCISTGASTNAGLCWCQQCFALCVPARYQCRVIAVNPDQSVGLSHCVPTNETLGTTWKRAQEMARKFLMFNFCLCFCIELRCPGVGGPVQDTAGSRQLCNGLTTGHSWAHRWRCHLWGGVCKKGQNAAWQRAVSKKVKQPSEHPGQRRRGRNCFRCWSRCFPCRPQKITCQSRYRFFWRNCSAWRGTVPEQAEGLQPVERTHDGATERSCCRPTATPIFHFALCCFGQGEAERMGVQSVELSLRKEGNRKKCAGLICFCFLSDLICFTWQ